MGGALRGPAELSGAQALMDQASSSLDGSPYVPSTSPWCSTQQSLNTYTQSHSFLHVHSALYVLPLWGFHMKCPCVSHPCPFSFSVLTVGLTRGDSGPLA